MADPTIEQALAQWTPAGVEIVARSPGFLNEWDAESIRFCTAFGTPAADAHLPTAVFAKPMASGRVAVVQVATQGTPPVLRFHILAVSKSLYGLIGDPFFLAEQYPPPWVERVALPTLAWLDELPQRTVEQLQRILQEEDGPTLLGAAQTLVDGGRVVFERAFPATDLLRRLWMLLPESTRAEVWPASFAYDSKLDVQAIVVPKVDPAAFPNYVTEAQAGDYPQGRYELDLQIAVEAGDQLALDGLLARRSSRQTLRLAIILLVLFAAMALASRYLH